METKEINILAFAPTMLNSKGDPIKMCVEKRDGEDKDNDYMTPV